MSNMLAKLIIGGLMFMVGILNTCYAQITVSATDAPSIPGTYFEMGSNDTVDVNLGQVGANQYWDFSTVPLPSKSYWQVVDYALSPFFYRFPTSNLVYKVTYDNNDTITYNYARLTESDLTELGRGKMTNSGIVTEIAVGKRTTPKLYLPATYGNPEWASVFVIDTTMMGFPVTVVDSSFNRIDAWGTIKTQLGEFPCLRIRQDHSLFAHTFFAKIPVEININYFWVANNYGILATVTGMSDLLNPPQPNYTKAKSVNIMIKFIGTSVQEISQPEKIKTFDLYQNYPNPFNATTTIEYQLNKPADVVLKVLNTMGQEVAFLVQAKKQPGKYEINWNAEALPSGIYYYQIQVNHERLTRKCLLLK